MSGRPVKHSVTLNGHRTSISLEDEFWEELKSIADAENISVASLIAGIDRARGTKRALSSALRLHVLHTLKAQIEHQAD